MKEWTRSIDINAPIETVWKLFDGSLANFQKIMPSVVSHEPVKVTEQYVGSIYRQQYKEGKRTEEYDVETLLYKDTPAEKELKVGFTLAKLFEITAYYRMVRTSDHTTKFTYTATNRPLKWFIKLFLWMANDKIVIEFLERVKRVAEAESEVFQ